MAEKAQINLTAMDFVSIRENLKTFLKAQDEFTDYNYEGSGLTVLLDLLAYNSQHTAYLANMLANESEIDSAILRSNIVSRAKLLGYTPKSKTAARAVLSVSITDPGNQATSLLMPRGTKFLVKSSNQQFNFLTLDEYNLNLDSEGVFRNDSIEVFEGNLKAYSFDVTSNERRYVLPSKKLDTNTLRVVVYENQNSTSYSVYEKATELSKINSASQAFWVYETDNGLYEIKFGDGVFGKQPPVNGIVYCEYLETNGKDANDFSQFSLVGTFAGYENADIVVSVVNTSSGGAEVEASSSIKINAPRFFQSQNRAITKEDFAAITTDLYPYAKSVAVWGGEELNPPKYGSVYISIIPQSITKLTSTNKRDLERKIKKRSVAGISPIITDPKFINLNMTVYATIRKNATNGLSNFSKQIKDLVETYFDNTFGIFDSDFYYSNLLTEIKNYSKAIVGVRVEYDISLVNSLTETDFNFENALVPGTIRTNKARLTGGVIFDTITDKDGVLYHGNTAIGTVSYTTGKVYIDTSKIQESSNGSLEVFALPIQEDIVCGFATALVLNKERLSVELRSV